MGPRVDPIDPAWGRRDRRCPHEGAVLKARFAVDHVKPSTPFVWSHHAHFSKVGCATGFCFEGFSSGAGAPTSLAYVLYHASAGVQPYAPALSTRNQTCMRIVTWMLDCTASNPDGRLYREHRTMPPSTLSAPFNLAHPHRPYTRSAPRRGATECVLTVAHTVPTP